MWKYVTRRVKDTVERTYNVLDVRISWPCGHEPANDKGSSAGQNNNRSQDCGNSGVWYKAKCAKNGQSSSSSHEDKGYDHAEWRCRKQALDTFVLVNALAVTWFTSRQHCLNHRYKKDWDKDTYWLSLKNACPFHAKPVGISTVQCAQHVPVCIEPANRLGAADVQRFYRPVPINNDHSTSSSGVKQIPAKKSVAVQASSSSSPIQATENLIRTLGRIEYVLGVENVKADKYEEAVFNFKLATEHGHPGATFNLGLCYETGQGIKKNMRKAMKCYRAAAALDHAKAMYNLGVFYAHGWGDLTKNRTAAMECFRAAVALGLVNNKILTTLRSESSPKIKSNSISDEGYKSDNSSEKMLSGILAVS